jgi:hypothetical protein
MCVNVEVFHGVCLLSRSSVSSFLPPAALQLSAPLLWLPFVISRRHRRMPFHQPHNRILFTFQITLAALQNSKSRQGE